MIICQEHRLVFVKTKKTAGTSIEIALGRLLKVGDFASPLYQDEEKLRPGKEAIVKKSVARLRERSNYTVRARNPHLGFKVAKDFLTDEIEGCFSFAVERNPWDKALSAFYFWMSRRGNAVKDPHSMFENFCLSEALSFFSNEAMYCEDNGLIVDLVLQYDTLGTEFQRLMTDAGIPETNLDGINAKGSVKPMIKNMADFYGDQYDLPAAKAVQSIFASEIELFGYTPPLDVAACNHN
jgi:hypothetical protein